MPDISLNCDIGGTWYRSGNYAGCCSTTGASCNTSFIYENTDDSNLRTDIFCGISSLNWSYYRVIPPYLLLPLEAKPSNGPQHALPPPPQLQLQLQPPILPLPPKKAHPRSPASSSARSSYSTSSALGIWLVWTILLRRRRNEAQAQAQAQAPLSPPPPPQSYVPYHHRTWVEWHRSGSKAGR
ncbi:hypothetical protein V2W45_447277 [Cenococcum geophilum]